MAVTVRCALAKSAPLPSFSHHLCRSRGGGTSRLAGRRPQEFVWQRQIVAAVYDRRLGAHRAPLQSAPPGRHRDSQGALGMAGQSHFYRSLSSPVCLSCSAGLQPGMCRPKGRRHLARRSAARVNGVEAPGCVAACPGDPLALLPADCRILGATQDAHAGGIMTRS